MKKINLGFTLIEIVITVAIVAILAAITYPAYQDSVRKSRRADAASVLTQAAQFMERFYTENSCYSNAKSAAGVICGGAGVALPAPLQFAPSDGATKYYQITLTGLGANTFTLNAVPQGAQSGDTDCGTLTLTNTGAKTVSGSKPVDQCWR